MSQKRKRTTGRPGRKLPKGFQSVPPPPQRLKPLFSALGDITHAADSALGGLASLTSANQQFDVAIMVRGINILKSVNVLTENGHWEMACSPARQLFELLLNMEDLNRHVVRETAAISFSAFGILQTARGRLEALMYEDKTGRSIDEKEKEKLILVLDSAMFAQFKGKPRADGSVRWVDSWNRKDARTMAEASDNKMRRDQYNQLFRRWSEETHATPGSLIDSIARTAGPGWIEAVVSDDDKRTAEVITMSVLMFFELMDELPHSPAIDMKRRSEWINTIHTWTHAHFSIPNPAPAK